jgi:hypothetical protein
VLWLPFSYSNNEGGEKHNELFHNKKFVFLLVVAIFTIFVIVALFRWKRLSDETWELPEKSINLGRMAVVSGVASGKRTFKIKNNSSIPIFIKEIVPSCALCTVIENFNREIPPKGEGICDVTFKLPLDDVFGRVVKIHIFPQNKELKTLILSVTIKSGFSTYLNPMQISFPDINLTSNEIPNAWHEFYIYHSGDGKIRDVVKNISTNKPTFLKIEHKEILSEFRQDADEEEYYFSVTKILVSLKNIKTLANGNYSATIFVETRGAGKIDVPVTWTIYKEETP